MNFFLREGKTEVPAEEPVGARAVTGTRVLSRTNKKLNPDEASPSRFQQCSTALAKFNLLLC